MINFLTFDKSVCYTSTKKEENSMEKESIEFLELHLRKVYENLNELEACREKLIMLTKLDEFRLWFEEYKMRGE